MGREKSTKVFSFESEKCPCSLFLADNNPCCDDEQEVLVVDDSQTLATSLAPTTPEFFSLGNIINIKPNEIFAYTSTQFLIEDFSPPPKEPLFKINCSFVFYEDELS